MIKGKIKNYFHTLSTKRFGDFSSELTSCYICNYKYHETSIFQVGMTQFNLIAVKSTQATQLEELKSIPLLQDLRLKLKKDMKLASGLVMKTVVTHHL